MIIIYDHHRKYLIASRSPPGQGKDPKRTTTKKMNKQTKNKKDQRTKTNDPKIIKKCTPKSKNGRQIFSKMVPKWS